MAWKLKRLHVMSKNNNVNPGQYKVAGRLRQDEDDRTVEAKKTQSMEEARLREEAKRGEENKQD